VDQWNSEEIICDGRHVTVIVNNATIVDADLNEAAAPETLDHKPHPGLERTTGHIALLAHGSRLEFRKLRIREFSAK
jgi:hypothetical protein